MKNATFKQLLSISVLAVLALIGPNDAHSNVDHTLLDSLLSQHVHNGQVNFSELCDDQRLEQYTNLLNQSDPAAISDDQARFAFWLNTYNAYSLEAICAEYPIESINDLNFGGLIFSVLTKRSVWDQPIVAVNGKTFTLKEVDHEILRPTFMDARIQFAIACGAIGCAPARNEAYQGDKLDEQLDDQAKTFINDTRNNTFNLDKREAELSPLFKWSKKDFGGDAEGILKFVAKYLPNTIQNSIMANPDLWDVDYMKYDLTLNDQK